MRKVPDTSLGRTGPPGSGGRDRYKSLPGGRITLDTSELQKLARSIERDGLREPLEVRPRDGRRYELVNGEARYWALRMNHARTAFCRVVTFTNREALERKMRGDEEHKVKRKVTENAWLVDREFRLLEAERFEPTRTLLMNKSGWSRGKVQYSIVIGGAISRDLFSRAADQAGLSTAEAAQISKRPLVKISKVSDPLYREELLTAAMSAMADENDPAVVSTCFCKIA